MRGGLCHRASSCTGRFSDGKSPYASKKGRAPKVLGASLLRDTTYGKANEEQFAAVRKPENFIVPGVRGYDVRADYEEMDDGR